MKRYPAEPVAGKRRLAAVFCCLIMGASALAAPLEAAAAGFVPRHGVPATHEGAVVRAGTCRDCGPPSSEPQEPCRLREPYNRPRSNIGMREMWELITHGAPMPGTDYYYYRMYEYRNGRFSRPRRCGS